MKNLFKSCIPKLIVFAVIALTGMLQVRGQYCTPTTTYACVYMSISNFSTTGGTTNITNNLSGCSADAYGNFTAMAVTQYAGSSFNISVQGVTYDQGFHIWADWNNDADFSDAGEDVWNSGTYGLDAFAGTITIPIGTSAGNKRMRVRSEYTAIPSDPCATLTYGETEDYTVAVASVAPCTGTPVPGGTTSTMNPVCSGASFTLGTEFTVTGAGITYQWKSSTAGVAGPYTNIAGATASTYTTSETVPTYYKCNVVCLASGMNAVSTPLYVSMLGFLECGAFCEATTGTPCVYMYINDFSTTGAISNITNNGSGCSAGGYGNFIGMEITAQAGTSFNFSVNDNGVYAEGYHIWADWNMNGSFTDAGEDVYSSYTGTAGVAYSGSIAIPATANIGVTRIRVRGDYAAAPADPCAALSYGETEDYSIDVQCNPVAEICNSLDDNCDGLIDNGVVETVNIYAGGPLIFCNGGSVLLTAIYSGTSVQWKRNGSAIAGATNSTYTATQKGSFTCQTSSVCGTATSSAISVSLYPSPSASITAGGPTTFCPGDFVVLTANAGGGLSYQWYKGPSAIAGATNMNYTATMSGNYKCRVTKNVTGCYKNSNSIVVTVSCKEGLSDAAISLFPNPVHQFLAVNIYPELLGSIYTFTDMTGRIVMQGNLDSENSLINLEQLPSGIYLLQIGTEKQSFKIVKN